MEQKWQVGLTGGIGAGKSTVALIFEALEIPIYYADNQARRLMREDSTLKREILDLLGPESFHEDGRLHRQFISQKVFGDHALLARLNGLVHPVVHQDATTWHQEQYKVPY
ncbi:MAG: dephospho-CoA kinase, partial [Saprospiraceae bacterium]|nr:dephospho-CoA kinase [Saprospiraceae bacterium]